MSDALWAAIITGGVAALAIVATVITTGRTLRYQRDAEDKRRRQERHIRLLDSGLRAAVDFLAAAERTTRARRALDSAQISLDQSRSSASQQLDDRFRAVWEKARESADAAIADAENAYAAVRMLVPSVSGQGRRYLDLCIKATIHPDETKVDRERARQMVEEAIRRAFGGDLPDNWVFAEPAPRPRWWQIRRRRADKRASLDAGTPRQS